MILVVNIYSRSYFLRYPDQVKPILIIVADDGRNVDDKELDYIGVGATSHFLWRLFVDLDLEALIFVKYAPGSSKYNPTFLIASIWSTFQ